MSMGLNAQVELFVELLESEHDPNPHLFSKLKARPNLDFTHICLAWTYLVPTLQQQCFLGRSREAKSGSPHWASTWWFGQCPDFEDLLIIWICRLSLWRHPHCIHLHIDQCWCSINQFSWSHASMFYYSKHAFSQRGFPVSWGSSVARSKEAFNSQVPLQPQGTPIKKLIKTVEDQLKPSSLFVKGNHEETSVVPCPTKVKSVLQGQKTVKSKDKVNKTTNKHQQPLANTNH